MATKRKLAQPAAAVPQSAGYEEAVERFAGAVELLHKGDFAAAKDGFESIGVEFAEETVMADRARTFARICVQRLAPAEGTPASADECYYRAVLRINDGRCDEAIRLLEQALESDAGATRLLYARATAWALKGNTEAAVGDLRQAIASEPTLRYQAANDPDFEAIREEPAFIDIIEPTPTGA